MNPAEKIARILRADPNVILAAQKALVRATGHDDVLAQITAENDRRMEQKLALLGVKEKQADKIYNALLAKIAEDDKKISKALGFPVCDSQERCASLLEAAREAAGIKKGFFLKTERAKELFERCPPLEVIEALGYEDVQQLLENEDIFEIFSALRFVEDGAWLNNAFFKQYERLTSDDFEEREIKTMVLGPRWKKVAEKFLEKKYHNISHLKELGVIFVLPAVLKINGETLRTLGLILHYFHEIDFYSGLFREYALASPQDFANKLTSALRGDVLEERFPAEDLGRKWMIVQRYLAKDDKHDWRLFEPHVNPEAIHWKKASDDISHLGRIVDNVDLSFWKDLNWVGGYYPMGGKEEVLVSFNLVDTVMSLVKKEELIKYLYHHQEALWNRIFSDFMGKEKMEQLIVANWEKGYIKI
jgi:glycerol-3-phosphate cytidylyltransferase-like family protein